VSVASWKTALLYRGHSADGAYREVGDFDAQFHFLPDPIGGLISKFSRLCHSSAFPRNARSWKLRTAIEAQNQLYATTQEPESDLQLWSEIICDHAQGTGLICSDQPAIDILSISPVGGVRYSLSFDCAIQSSFGSAWGRIHEGHQLLRGEGSCRDG
jgi:hypothetical protein